MSHEKKRSAEALTDWATRCLESQGATCGVAQAMAKHLVAGDLMGFRTHGLLRLRYNLQALAKGATKASGQPRVAQERAAIALWDADLLSGLYVLPQAIEKAIAMARDYGTGTVIVRRTQHVAALAVYLEQATAAGMLIQMMCSTPAQQVVAPFGAKSASFSPNPFAIGVPTTSDPVLLDMSLSMTAAGKVRTAIAEGKQLPYPALITAEGDYSCDPNTFVAEPASVLASLGGEALGYKGTGLNLFSEFWTLALSDYGRADAQAADGDANTVWLQVVDPSALMAEGAFERQAQQLVAAVRQATPITPAQPIRLPGEGALSKRRQQLQTGIEYSAATWRQLEWCAEFCDEPLP
ncbi:L-lactate dehydrogenase [Pseudidiomarina piscicola]|uniref:L-lactate dehydrogenase n=1 Tax=Pseudidiomarina piscicola TaxID=2614830 RepID=A0A6S6WQQ8_9GAMM|nr:Ldh family oxidoreductase [Pseudidiomarina piscicola]CAB0151816.1 L-lactate dehydrogenase [Pseudidiomarina piscicola]VZT41262.1 L-lactate dehydrogenase [Pseudomonas aeruginosa]